MSKTRTTGDFGADLVLESAGVRTVVQAKRYDSPVGIEAVQEVIGAKAHYGASDAWVVTNSSFTPAAETLAAENGVQLFARDGLVDCLAQQNTDSLYGAATRHCSRSERDSNPRGSTS